MTQQNAALVEESAAAAESLKTQAQQLVQAVAVFKLVQGEPSQIAKPVPAAPAATSSAERRGPNRATNVVRPTFAAAAARPAAVAVAAPHAKTGTEDWESF